MRTAPLDLLAALVLEDGRPWGEVASPVQWRDAQAFLADDAPPYAFWTRARGYSKTSDAAGIALALMLTGGTAWRGVWVASDGEQAALGIDAMAGYVARTPLLRGQVEVTARRVRVVGSGARLDVLPADAPGAWGLRPDLVVADERAMWRDSDTARRLWEAVSTATTKRPHARMLVVTTASAPSHPAYQDLEHARASDLWAVSETPGPPPWAEPARLAEQEARLPESVYRQLFLNEWTEVEGSFLEPALIDAAFTLDGPRTEPTFAHAAGLDLGATHDRTALAVVHREGEEVCLDRLRVWQGTRQRPVSFAEVVASVEALHEQFRLRKLLADPWQALHVSEQLRGSGIPTEHYTFTAASKGRLAGTLYQLVQDGRLKLYPADGLRDELRGLRLVPTPVGGWAFDHARSGHDDRAVALALACVAALQLPSGVAESVNLRTLRARATRPVLVKGGLTVGGGRDADRYLDKTTGGDRVPPPGWTQR